MADEGMWPFNLAPIQEINDRGKVQISQPWLDRAMRASVRLSSGGSAGFVSKNGLLLTNHHVASSCIQKLSQKSGTQDYMKDGFLARSGKEELRCPDLEANVLLRIEDVTDTIEGAAKLLPATTSDAEKNAARKAETAKIEKLCADKSGHRCDVVTLWAGAAYHLYEYERHQDVRLVFAPELDIAFFGGDQENFTFPRHCLDVAFLRIYSKDAPLATPSFFLFDRAGAKEEQITFVSGNPGSTDRFAAYAKLQLLEKKTYPFQLARLIELRDRLRAYSIRGEKEGRAALNDLGSIDNWIKAVTGYLAGLRDPKLMSAADKREKKLLAEVNNLKDAALKKRLLAAWPKLRAAYKKQEQIYEKHAVLEGFYGPGGKLALSARQFIRLGEELQKPNETRLREYRESALPAIKSAIESDEVIDEGLEIEKVTIGLENMQRALGKNNPTVKKVLAGKTPRTRAEEAVKNSGLKDVAKRKELLAGGPSAIEAAQDSMIELVRSYDGAAREIRKTFEDQVESVERQYAGAIVEAYAAAFGKNIYPDATFTPRINHGFVRAYEEGGGKIPWATSFAGLYVKNDMSNGGQPHVLPKKWIDAKSKLDLDTPLNFVTTNDIIGGNSGSPTFNAAGKLIGVVFDNNLSQLPNRFLYREETQRAIHVDGIAILHALDKVYGAKELLRELLP
jgi:hypothetical protein